MLPIYIFLFFDLIIFSTGLTYSLIDVERYSFGLYLILISIVGGSLLAAVWVIKPQCCLTPRWVTECWGGVTTGVIHLRQKHRNPRTPAQDCIPSQDTYKVLQNIKAIPQLMQAIYATMESTDDSTLSVHPQFYNHRHHDIISSGYEEGIVDSPEIQNTWVETHTGDQIYNPHLKLAFRRESLGMFPLSESGPFECRRFTLHRHSSAYTVTNQNSDDEVNDHAAVSSEF